MNSIVTYNGLRFIVLILIQVIILNNINFLGYINPYIYILFVILYPVKNNRPFFIFVSFLLGLAVDLFSDSGGVHAAATVTIAYIRPILLKFSFGSIYDHQTIKFEAIEFTKRVIYITIITLIHHLLLFSLEIFSLDRIILILKKALFSSIFTIILCILITILFSRKDR